MEPVLTIIELPQLLEDIINRKTDKLIVDVKKPEIYNQVKPHGDRSSIKGKRKALIVNITSVNGMLPREGADVDSCNLKKLLEGLGFDVYLVPDSKTTKSGIEEEFLTFMNICKRDEVDCFLIYTGSHGMNDILFTSDGETLDIYNDLIYPFQFEVFEQKDGKSVEKRVVRVFINQSCQGEPRQLQRNANKSKSVDMKDTVYMKAQIPKYPAYRNKRFGSYFVLVLTYVLMTKAWYTSLQDMLLEVQELLRNLGKREGFSQFPPSTMMGLKDPVYFFKNPFDVDFDVSPPIKIFTGRNRELRDLQQKFQSQKQMNPDAEAYIVSIIGMGGIGKSELARKYCRVFVGANIWLNAETEEALAESFRRLATERLNISSRNIDGTEKSTTTIIAEVFMYFHGKPCLFVFDNLETDEIFQKFTKFAHPNPNPPFVLITSQFKIWTTTEEEILELTKLTEEEAFVLVKNCLNLQDNEQDGNVLELIRKMQCLPIAITSAISCISLGGGLWANALSAFLKQFSLSLETLFETENSPNLYTRTINTTFKMTLDVIGKRNHGEKAIRLLGILSYFQRDKIPTEIFDSKDYKDALQLLLQFSVVTIQSTESFVGIHSMMQVFVRMSLRETKKEEMILKDALSLLSRNASQNTVIHMFSVLKSCNNMVALQNDVGRVLSAHYRDSTIMTSLLKGAEGRRYITIEKNGNKEEDWNVTMNLRPIIGIGSDASKIGETYALSQAHKTDSLAKIIEEPLPQLFIDCKWSKMKYLIAIRMIFNFLWTASLCVFLVSTEPHLNFRASKQFILYNNPLLYYGVACLTLLKTFLGITELIVAAKPTNYWRRPQKNCDWVLFVALFVFLCPNNFQLPKIIDIFILPITKCIICIRMVWQCFHLTVTIDYSMKSLIETIFPCLLIFSPPMVYLSTGKQLTDVLTLQFDNMTMTEPMKATDTKVYHDNLIDFVLNIEKPLEFLICCITLGVTQYMLMSYLMHKDREEKARQSSMCKQLCEMRRMESLMKKLFALLPNLAFVEKMCLVTKNQSIVPSGSEAILLLEYEDPYIVTRKMKEFSHESQERLREWDRSNMNVAHSY